jgi:hypothetical protein
VVSVPGPSASRSRRHVRMRKQSKAAERIADTRCCGREELSPWTSPIRCHRHIQQAALAGATYQQRRFVVLRRADECGGSHARLMRGQHCTVRHRRPKRCRTVQSVIPGDGIYPCRNRFGPRNAECRSAAQDLRFCGTHLSVSAAKICCVRRDLCHNRQARRLMWHGN